MTAPQLKHAGIDLESIFAQIKNRLAQPAGLRNYQNDILVPEIEEKTLDENGLNELVLRIAEKDFFEPTFLIRSNKAELLEIGYIHRETSIFHHRAWTGTFSFEDQLGRARQEFVNVKLRLDALRASLMEADCVVNLQVRNRTNNEVDGIGDSVFKLCLFFFQR